MAARHSRRLDAVARHLATPTRATARRCAAPAAASAASRLAEYEALVGVASRSAAARAEYEARKERVYEAFADKEACAYHVADARGKRIIYRGIEFEEFRAKVHDIDRSESRTGSYHLTDDGGLRLDTTPDELPDWDDDKRATHTEHVRKCTEHGGVIIGAFDLQPSGHQVLVGCTVLDGEWILAAKDTLDMYFLFSSRTLKQKYVDAGGEPTDYRDAGIGGTLIEKIMGEARARGAKNMYISSANSQHTVEFYMRKGAVQAKGDQVQEIPNAGFAGTQDIQLIRPLYE